MSAELDIPRHWRLQKERYRLLGNICEGGHKLFPPREVCPHCKGEKKEPFQFIGKGKIYSFTVVQDAPADFTEQTPFYLATIELEEGSLITAQLTDFGDGEPQIGMEVEMVTRKIKETAEDRGMAIYGYKFRQSVNQLESL